MSADFRNVAILGSGLLGGSLAMALRDQGSSPRLWARSESTAAQARGLGIEGATSELREAVSGADLLVLAVPVGAMPGLLKLALDCGIESGALVTDVGSVKRLPHQTLPALLQGSGVDFIGSHPMAGSERNGLDAARVDLFQGAACLLTHDAGVPAERAGALECFWQKLGCHTSWMDAAVHDALVARISHLPHLIAAAAAQVCLVDPGQGKWGGGGLRDTTRVAAGNPDMWAEILLENSEALVGPLRESIAALDAVLECLESADHAQLRDWLVDAKSKRDSLPPPGAA